MIEISVLFFVIFAIYGAGWFWQTIHDILRDIRRTNWDGRVYGQVASAKSVRKTLGGLDLGRLRQTFRTFAEAREGKLHDHQLFESPEVSFVYQTSRALLSIYESSDPVRQLHTQLTFTIPQGWGWRLEVFPQRFKDMDVKYLNVDDIQFGDPAFDPRYVVKSNDEKFAKEFLDAQTRQRVEDLRNLTGNDRILVSVNASRLLVRKPSVLGEPDALKVFSDLSSRIYDRIFLFWQKASGIEILEDEPAVSKADPICQVCGVPASCNGRVYCRRCRTPHHRDCWEFNGTCSTYACGEKNFTAKY